jgi:hypothetical protein
MKPFSVIFKSAITILFISIAGPAFAQHGGGGHGGGGGGFHGGGGGGFHGGGGGMRSSGGGGPRGGSFSPPSSGYGAARGFAPSTPRSSNGFAGRQGNNFSRPGGGNFANGNARVGNAPSGSAPGNAANGGWHSFGGGNPNGGRGPGGAQSQAGSPNNAGGFRTFSGNRGTAPSGTVRSFSGQGNEIWENSSAARNMVPKSQSLSTLHNSFVGSRAATGALRPNASLSASSRFAGGSALMGNRGFTGGFNGSRSVQPLRSTNRFGVPFGGNRFGGFGFGHGFGRGFGFSFGRGWGWGWGWPGWGFWGWGWDPFFYDPWWGGPGLGYGYGYYGGYSNNYVYPDAGYDGTDYNSAPPAQQPDYSQDNSYDENYQGNSNGNWITPNEPGSSSAQRSPSMAVPFLIYMKGGRILSVRDYWMVDDELHYVLMSGVQNSVDLEQVDLPRTNTENAKSGVRFIFKSEPSAAPPAPNPAPTQELHAVPQPEATT